ncbi:TetR/AcrR family transcriptional regulator [Pseudonocardia sp. GCM10023141]|uniref:TetR/AcrR family transcriptional regulator n=1 Tax=Pseudonocardia sp. GCM10023141 TaxID=3252653 RepID=UPI0036175011
MDVQQDDLTARARIRDAAMAEFAERGLAGTTIRAVAERAGVSPALVQHHFGTKQRLREACDAHVVDYLRREAATGIDDGLIDDPGYIASIFRSAPPLLRYLARALVDGSPAAAGIFDDMVALTESYLADVPGAADARTRAVVFTAMRLGLTVMHDHVSRGLGVDLFSREGSTRVANATLDVVAPEIIPDGMADRVRTGLDRFGREEQP